MNAAADKRLMTKIVGATKLRIDVTRIYQESFSARTPIVINRGGARSSKTFSISQGFFVRQITCKKRTTIVIRKTMPSMRLPGGPYQTILNLFKQHGFYQEKWHNRSDHTYRIRENQLIFASIDDPSRYKSTEFNDAWIEEANELTWDDFMTIKLRLSAPLTDGLPNQMFLSYNPSNEGSYVRRLETKSAWPVTIIDSNYRDNPFLSDDYIKNLEALKDQDENYWRVYGLGQYSVPLQRVYSNWDVVDSIPGNITAIAYGLDFGFNHPSALTRLSRHEMDLWEEQLIYQTRLTNGELIDLCKTKIPDWQVATIWADSAEPDRIKEFNTAGFRGLKPAPKGPGSIRTGIDIVKRFKIHILSGSDKLVEEKQRYSWPTDKDGNPVEKDPIDFMNHLMSAERYAVVNEFGAGLLQVKAAQAEELMTEAEAEDQGHSNLHAKRRRSW